MKYLMNLSLYTDAFVFPSVVARDHLKLIGLSQIKVLLWMLSHGGVCDSLEVVSKDTGLPISEIPDALQYWIDNKIILAEGENPQPIPSVKDEPSVKIPAVITTSKKPTAREVVKLANSDINIKWLLDEAVVKFARDLSEPEMSSLVWMNTVIGLPAEVVLMLVQYAISNGKGNIRYMEKLAVSWAENDIVTVSSAEKHLQTLEKTRKNWSVVAKAFGITDRVPSDREKAYVNRWVNEWRFSVKMFKEAYNRCIDNTSKFSMAYINKILEGWYAKGFKTVEDVEKFYSENSDDKKHASTKNRSYNISDIDTILVKNGDKKDDK